MSIHSLWRLSLLILALSFSTAQAATYTVTNKNDSGVGSLRQAVIDANALPTSDDIVFDSGVTWRFANPQK